MQIYTFTLSRGSQSVDPRPAESASLGNLLERQTFRPHPRPTDSEALGRGSSSVCCGKPSWCSQSMLKVPDVEE